MSDKFWEDYFGANLGEVSGDCATALAPMHDHYNGYVRFRLEDIPSSWHGDYDADPLQFLDVHGGLTHARVEGDYAVFGFDTIHASDELNGNFRSSAFVMRMTKDMHRQIKELSNRWVEYCLVDDTGKGEILDDVRRGEIA